jgi:hypothetical protein
MLDETGHWHHRAVIQTVMLIVLVEREISILFQSILFYAMAAKLELK